MKLYIKQKVFSWKDKFKVLDELGNEKYFVEGEFLSLGKKLHISNCEGKEIALISQKLMSLLPKFFVYRDDEQVAEIVSEFSPFRPKYSIKGLGWEIVGDMFEYDYSINKDGNTIVSISKKWMSWGDSYELDIHDASDEIIALSVVLAIDCVTATKDRISSLLSNSD